MVIWIIVALAFSFLILVHELGHFIAALSQGIKVEIFSFGFGRPLVSFKRKGIEYRISIFPFGGYVKMAGDEMQEKREGHPWEFLSAPAGKKIKVAFAGALCNYLAGLVLLCLIFYIGYPISTKVGSVLPGYPAEAAGIKAGDTIVAIDGKPVRNWMFMTDVIKGKTKGSIALALKRDDSVVNVSITPKVQTGEDIFRRKVKIGLIGITPQIGGTIEYEKFGIMKSVELGVSELLWMTKVTYKGIWYMLIGQVSIKESMGPIGIISVIGVAAKLGLTPLLGLVATISVALAVFNLLPLLPLDGGYIIFFVIEKLRGRPVSKKIFENFMNAGWFLVILLFMFTAYNDIPRILGK